MSCIVFYSGFTNVVLVQMVPVLIGLVIYRIYARGLNVVEAHVHCAFPAAKISDHAALAATFELKSSRK